jgi:alkylhydroperoxidase family enzyme
MAQAKATASRGAVKRKTPAKQKSTAKRKPQAKQKSVAKRKVTTRGGSGQRKIAQVQKSKGIGPRKKRTTNAVDFIGEAARKFAEAPSIQAIYDGRLEEDFREVLMVAVAFQNQATYCNWIHRTWASQAGVPDEELAKVEKPHLDGLDPKVSTAVIYVRALVSSDWKDAPSELRQQMQEYFTWREIKDIELIARAMDLSNRAGNTWDAMLSRLQGKPVDDSDLLSEIVFSSVFLAVLPDRLSKVSRLTGATRLEAAQSMLKHVQQFNQQKAAG